MHQETRKMTSSPLKHTSHFMTYTQSGVTYACPNSLIVQDALTLVMSSTVNLSPFYLIISKCHRHSTSHESSPPYGHLFEL